MRITLIRMTYQPPSDTVGSLVRARMLEVRVSQYSLARHLKLSQPAISRRLAGDVEFSISELAETAKILDLPMGDLLPSPVGEASTSEKAAAQ